MNKKKKGNEAQKQSLEKEDTEQEDDDDVRKIGDFHKSEDFEKDNPIGNESRTTTRQHP